MTRSFLKMLTAAGCIAAAAIARGRHRPGHLRRDFRRRRHLSVSDLREMGRRLQKGDGVGIAYQPVGSSEGIRQIDDKEVTFGASDMPLNAADLDAHGLVHFRPWWAASSRS